MTFLLRFFPWLTVAKLWAIGIVLGLALAYVGGLHVALWWKDHQLVEKDKQLKKAEADLKTQKDERKAEREAAISLAEAKRVQHEAALTVLEAKQVKTLRDLEDANEAIKNVSADLARVSRMRDAAIAAYARGDGSAAAAAGCADRAEALGRVLSEALQTAEELTGDSEANAADARSLREVLDATRAAWPR